MSGMENGSRQAAVNGMDGKGNASVTMETVGRHWRTKTRNGSTETSARIIADSMDVDRTRNVRKKDGNDMVKRDDGHGGQGKEWKKEEWERDDARYDERCDEESGR